MWNGRSVSVVLSTDRDVRSVPGMIEGLFATGVADEIVTVDNNADPGTREEVAATDDGAVGESVAGLRDTVRFVRYFPEGVSETVGVSGSG